MVPRARCAATELFNSSTQMLCPGLIVGSMEDDGT
jgi:hypothetical protein